jgi:tetratricopeptide (TPR) repeat protein
LVFFGTAHRNKDRLAISSSMWGVILSTLEVAMFRVAPVLLVYFCLIFPVPISAQRAVDIGGRVLFADNNQPASHVTVSVLNIEHQPLLSDFTSDTGEFRFSGLGGGQYIVSIQVSGYEPVAINVDMAFEVDNGLLIYLKPVAKTANPARQPTVSAHELSMPAKAREAFALGQKKLYQDKDAQGALADFQRALSIAPTYFEASYQLGVAHLTLGNVPDAEADFRTSISSSRDRYAPADVRLGSLLLDRSNFAESERLIRKGISLDPNFWLGHYELGRALFSQNHLPEALSAAEEARLRAPSEPIVYRLLSNIHLLQKDYPALIEDLDAYIALDPDSPAGVRAKQVRDQIQHNRSVQDQHFAAVHP